VSAEGEERTIMIAAIRYQDTFAKVDGTWRFSERRLYVDGSITNAATTTDPDGRPRTGLSDSLPSKQQSVLAGARLTPAAGRDD
jgi:hypothetical protein